MKHILLPKPVCFLALFVLLATVSCIGQAVKLAPTFSPTDTPAPTDTPTATVTPVATATLTPTPTPITAESLLSENPSAMETLETFAMHMSTTVTYMDQTVKMSMDGVIENPGKSHFLVETRGQRVELVTLSQDDIYTRVAGKVWIKSPVTELAPNYKSQIAPGDISKSLELQGKETLDGTDTYVIAYSIDMGKFLALDPTILQLFNPLQSTGKGIIWIGTEDFRTRKFSMELMTQYSGNKLIYTYEGSMSDFDKPVQIPDPIPYYTQIVLRVGDPVFAVVFSPDSSVLAACDDDQLIYLWSTADLSAKPKIIEHPDLQIAGLLQTADYYSLAFSPDGETLAAGTQGQVLLYSLADLTRDPVALKPSGVAKERGTDFDSVAYSPDGKLLAAGGAVPNVYVWATGKLNAVPRALSGHTSPVVDLSFAPDGKTLISGSEDGKILLWSVNDLSAPRKILARHKSDFHALEVTPDGKYLLSVGFNDPVYVWSMTQLENQPDSLIPRTDESLGKSPTLDIAISPDGQTLATADTFGVVHLWSLSDPEQPFATLSTQSQYDIMTVSFSPDGNYLAAGSGDARVYVWVLKTKP